MGTGRLIRQAQAQEADRSKVCQCGHEKRLHLERRVDDPKYLPLHFICYTCGCELVAR